MNRNQSVYRLVVTALLCAVGILIPMTFPKISIPPMSFTLASHVPIFLAAFLSPMTAGVVAVGTTAGFVFSGLPPTIWLRAATHLVWALVAALWVKSRPDILYRKVESAVFCVVIGVIHAVCEVLVIIPLFFGGMLSAGMYESGFFRSIILLVGVGTFFHSTVDYILAILVWRPLRHVQGVRNIASAG